MSLHLQKGIFDTETSSNDWLFFSRIDCPVHFRLVCFPPAGMGPVVFRGWAAELPPSVNLCGVHLPGRTSRFREPAMTSVPELIEAITRAIAPLPELPFAFFGHSMGAVLAEGVTRRLMELSLPIPRHLIVSGRRPPSMPDPNPPIGGLSDAAFVDEIGRRYDGIPREILANPDVLELLLPSLRADIVALEKFQPGPRPPLSIPVSAFGGDSDPMTPPADLMAWEKETQASFKLRIFPGGHFYLDAQRKAVVGEITRLIKPIMAEVEARA
jgi:surfactin synthase thioesterase subunit